MKFDIPKRHYYSGEEKVTAWRLPEKLHIALEKFSQKIGWSRPFLLSMVVDQYLYSVQSKKDLPKYSVKYAVGETKSRTYKIDSGLYKALNDWCHRRPHTVTDVIIQALDLFLQQEL